MTIIALSAFKDNYIWVVKNKSSFFCVDPGDAQPVLDFAKQEQLTLSHILLTHHHADHIGGVRALKKAFPHVVIHDFLNSQDQLIQVDTYNFNVLSTPGHTKTHVCYFEPEQQWLFCGDTLFSAGCGRVFDGSLSALYQSLEVLKQLPDSTKIYCAHEYTYQNLKFALTVEPNNQNIQQYLSYLEANPTENSLPSTIGKEKRINPFLRLEQPDVHAFVEQHGGDATTQETCFVALRHAKDCF